MNNVDNEKFEEEFESPVHEMIQNSYFYERTSVDKSRIDKFVIYVVLLFQKVQLQMELNYSVMDSIKYIFVNNVKKLIKMS